MRDETERKIIEEINEYFDRCEKESEQIANIVRVFVKRVKKMWNNGEEKKED